MSTQWQPAYVCSRRCGSCTPSGMQGACALSALVCAHLVACKLQVLCALVHAICCMHDCSGVCVLSGMQDEYVHCVPDASALSGTQVTCALWHVHSMACNAHVRSLPWCVHTQWHARCKCCQYHGVFTQNSRGMCPDTGACAPSGVCHVRVCMICALMLMRAHPVACNALVRVCFVT